MDIEFLKELPPDNLTKYIDRPEDNEKEQYFEKLEQEIQSRSMQGVSFEEFSKPFNQIQDP